MKKTVIALSLCSALGLPLPSFADMAQKIAQTQAGSCADALKRLTTLANGGHGAAQIALAELHENDRRCPELNDATKARQWYLRAAESGDVAAQMQVARSYQYGEGVPKDQARAAQWYAKAAAQGDEGAQASLGTMYEDAQGVARDRVLAHLLKSLSAAARSAKGDNEYNVHVARYAEQLSPDQLAESKRLASQWKPGKALPTTSATGRTLPSLWYRKSAEAGDVGAAYRLGVIYKQGYEDGQDDGQAVEWLRRAAEQGHTDAQQALSEMYAQGRGVPEDYVLGYMLGKLAANGGNERAKTAWQEYWAVTLAPPQLAEGQALAAQWVSGTPLPLSSQHGLERKVQRAKQVKAKLEATPDALALFNAANEGDEAAFMRLLGTVGNLNDYAVEQHTLLHALLLPPKSLRDKVLDWKRSNRGALPPLALAQNWRALHLDLLPAKTRMLDVALRRGASVQEGEPDLHAAPLHLASMFGSPEMVRLLLRAGASPRQYGGQQYVYAPLEYSLQLKEHGMDLPPMLTAPQRSDIILQLLAAGAERPFKSTDDAAAIMDPQARERPSADYQLWDELVTLTSGADVLTAVAATGTAPYFDPKEKTVLARAAQAGNVGAVKWLKQRLPRSEEGGPDSWTDAAIWAMYGKPETADAMLRELLVKDMAWAQIGPLRDAQRASVTLQEWPPGPAGPATLLGHAALAGRAEWVRQLVTWGAPVGARENGQTALSQAVLAGDAKMVELLLDLGANPAEDGAESTLQLAVESTSTSNDVLRLLVNDVVRKKRIALDDIESSPLRSAFSSDDDAKLDSERIKMLIDAGFSAAGLNYRSLAAAMAANDRTLFDYLLAHGALKPAPGTDHSPMLVAAMRAKRADLLPRLLQLGLDPNARPEKGFTPLEHAIRNGDGAAFDLFMQHGGRIDLAASGPWGTALDLAVVSGNADILRTVSKQHSVALGGVCLPSARMLHNTVLDSGDAYWTLLRKNGFGADPARCPAMVERLVQALAALPGDQQIGWVGRRLAARLKDLSGPGAAISDATAALLHAAGRADLLQALQAGGWKAAAAVAPAVKSAAAPSAGKADLALQKQLIGHYYLENMREVGSEIVLSKDGRFSYSLAYGADDQFATGTWRVLNKQVVFRSQVTALPAPYALRAQAAADTPSPEAEVAVLVQYKNKKIPGISVTLIGEEPVRADGVTKAAAWSAPMAGPLKHIVLYHPELNGGRAYVHNVTDGARAFHFEATAPQPRMEDFNLAMAVRDGELVWLRDGRNLVYKRPDKAK